MQALAFILAVHNHQPVGNQPEVVERVYQSAYLPFIEALEEVPDAKVAIHYSGSLIDWLIDTHPEFVDRVCRLVRHGQVELLAGAYYEPILAIIPDEDKVEQIQAFTSRLQEVFGTTPAGFWLAERAWEPHLAKHIRDAGMHFTFLDDTIFYGAGIHEQAMFQHYLTEDQGRPLIVFPIPQRLRYLVPFEDPTETIAYLKAIEAHDNAVAVLADDGEKFGAWPGTYETVYGTKQGQGWLQRFVSLLDDQEIRMLTPSEYVRQASTGGHVYLPTASYSELMEWALPVEVSTQYQEAQKRLRAPYAVFLRGGYWRNFLTKYEESNHLYRKMLYVAAKVQGMHGPTKREAKREVWKGQCNDAYWHGVFGGLYLSHLRAATFQHLIRAEQLADLELHAPAAEWLELAETDFDGDLQPEILVNTQLMSAYVDPWRGGTLVEWDLKSHELNLLDTLTRRPEAYHKELMKHRKRKQTAEDREKATSIHELVRTSDETLKRYLVYDTYRRVSLIDHFLPPVTRMQAFATASFTELGDFVTQPYRYETRIGNGTARIALFRLGNITSNGTAIPLAVTKTIIVTNDRPQLTLLYQLENRGTESFQTLFGTELNLSPVFAHLHSGASQESAEALRGVHERITSFVLTAAKADIRLQVTTSIPATVWQFPVYTVSQSEKGFERGLQGWCVLPLWMLELEPGSRWEAQLTYSLAESQRKKGQMDVSTP